MGETGASSERGVSQQAQVAAIPETERCGMCGGSGVMTLSATDGEVRGRCWPCGGDGRVL